jgi:hypothetical protein
MAAVSSAVIGISTSRLPTQKSLLHAATRDTSAQTKLQYCVANRRRAPAEWLVDALADPKRRNLAALVVAIGYCYGAGSGLGLPIIGRLLGYTQAANILRLRDRSSSIAKRPVPGAHKPRSRSIRSGIGSSRRYLAGPL